MFDWLAMLCMAQLIQRPRLSGQEKPEERHMGVNQIYFLLENKLVCLV